MGLCPKQSSTRAESTLYKSRGETDPAQRRMGRVFAVAHREARLKDPDKRTRVSALQHNYLAGKMYNQRADGDGALNLASKQ